MALQSSGQIKLSEIATEFGGTAPHALSEYHGEGNAPSSGEIQLAADFYGTSSNIAQFTITAGQFVQKQNLVETGFKNSTGLGGSLNYGSTSGTITFANRTIVGLFIVDDAALSNQTRLNVVFNGTSNADSIWTNVTVHNITRNRVNFSGNVLNNTAYQYTIVLGNSSFTNPIPNGTTRTITFN